jgi:hypothetical protein
MFVAEMEDGFYIGLFAEQNVTEDASDLVCAGGDGLRCTGFGTHAPLVACGKGVDTMDWEDLGQEDGTSMPWHTSTLILKR